MASKKEEPIQAPVGRRAIAGVLQIRYGASHKIVSVVTILTCMAFKERETWVAYCRELDLSSCGDTQEQAKRHLKEAIGAFFEDCIEEGTLERALFELGWKCRMPDNHLVECDEVELPRWMPPAFMIERMGRGAEWQMQLKVSGPRQ